MKNVVLALIVLFPAVAPAFMPAYAEPLPKVIRHVDNPPPSRLPVYVPEVQENESEPEEVIAPLSTAPHSQSMEAFVKQLDLIYGQTDPGDLVDVELTYMAMEQKMGRALEIREILYIVIWSEYWLAVRGKTHALLGQEALARSYYHFCGEDGDCTHEELVKFLSGYQPWFGNLAKIDLRHEKRADRLYELLTNEYNYAVNGEEVYGYVDQILDVEYAAEQGWTEGKVWNRPSQWYGPSGPPPAGATVGSYTSSYAISSVPYDGGYFYFVTYGQEQSFTPTSLP